MTATNTAPRAATPLVSRVRPRGIDLSTPDAPQESTVPADIRALAVALAAAKAEESKAAAAVKKAEKQLSTAILAAELVEKPMEVLVGLEHYDFGVLSKTVKEYSAEELYKLVPLETFLSIAKVGKGDIEKNCGAVVLSKVEKDATKAPALTFAKRKGSTN